MPGQAKQHQRNCHNQQRNGGGEAHLKTEPLAADRSKNIGNSPIEHRGEPDRHDRAPDALDPAGIVPVEPDPKLEERLDDLDKQLRELKQQLKKIRKEKDD